MRAVVLVGGFGTRLRPLTYSVPKPMLPVGHVPIIERLVANLVRGGALFSPLHYVTPLPAAPQEEAEINPQSGARRGRQSSCRRACC
jgi:hypothetical protein